MSTMKIRAMTYSRLCRLSSLRVVELMRIGSGVTRLPP
jgi:hypothetical protein